MRFTRKYFQGWYNDSWRHSLAAKGVKTRISLAKQMVVPQMSEQQKLTQLAVDFADAKITESQLANRKDLSPQELSLILDQAREITSRRSLGDVMQKKAQQIWQTPFGMPKRDKGAAQVPTAEKVRGEAELAQALAEEQRAPFRTWITRLEAGDFTNPVPPDNEAEKLVQRAAAVEGVQERVKRGDGLKKDDWENLEKVYGLSHDEINRLKVYQNQVLPSALRKAGRVLGDEALAVEEKAVSATTGFLKKGWGNLRDRVRPSIDEISGGEVGPELKKIEGMKAEIEGAAGVFNPWGKIGVSEEDAKAKEAKRQATYASAISAQRDLDALYANKGSLARVDLSGYSKGERAFKSGNREMLLDAITELDAQHMKLQDRMWHVEAVRTNLLRKDTMDQTIAMGSDGGGWSMFGGSGGGNAIVQQTKKVNQLKEGIKKSSNEVAGRLAMLRNKLKRMDATVPPIAPVPEVPVKVFKQGGFMGSDIDILPRSGDYKRGTAARVSQYNPVLSDKISNPVVNQMKDLRNPILEKGSAKNPVFDELNIKNPLRRNVGEQQ